MRVKAEGGNGEIQPQRAQRAQRKGVFNHEIREIRELFFDKIIRDSQFFAQRRRGRGEGVVATKKRA